MSVFDRVFDTFRLNSAGKAAAKIAFNRMGGAERAIYRTVDEIGRMWKQWALNELSPERIDLLYIASLLLDHNLTVKMIVHIEDDRGLLVMEKMRLDLTIDRQIMEPGKNPFNSTTPEGTQ